MEGTEKVIPVVSIPCASAICLSQRKHFRFSLLLVDLRQRLHLYFFIFQTSNICPASDQFRVSCHPVFPAHQLPNQNTNHGQHTYTQSSFRHVFSVAPISGVGSFGKWTFILPLIFQSSLPMHPIHPFFLPAKSPCAHAIH